MRACVRACVRVCVSTCVYVCAHSCVQSFLHVCGIVCVLCLCAFGMCLCATVHVFIGDVYLPVCRS